MFNSDVDFSVTMTFIMPALQCIYLPNRPTFAWALTHCLVLQGNCTFFVLQLQFCHRPLWNRHHVPKPAPLPLSLVDHGPEGSHKGCHRQSNQGGEKQKQKKTKVPLTTLGVPASPCCFFMWLSRVRWDLKDLSHI